MNVRPNQPNRFRPNVERLEGREPPAVAMSWLSYGRPGTTVWGQMRVGSDVGKCEIIGILVALGPNRLL